MQTEEHQQPDPTCFKKEKKEEKKKRAQQPNSPELLLDLQT